MPTRTVDPHRLHRADRAVLAALVALAILVGIWPLTGVLTTYVPLLAVPAAAGLPYLIPALRPMPLGDTTWAFWLADVAGVLVMLLVAFVVLRAPKRRAVPSPGRAFGRGVWVTTVAVVAGNLVRGVFTSFTVHADLGTYLGTTAANVVVSAITGALLGLVVGAVAAIVATTGRGSGGTDSDGADGDEADAAADAETQTVGDDADAEASVTA
ncbi:hypothetical protein ASD23_04925 [Agromyces sp. Root1464]|uniref:hypothetical protein n=1 Tax=Agromyces sp. Root1464 TaxID=1736467 RepID=UPI0006FE0E7B|nr:hypothetical protein [Agromyces sp. Root1464]KQZ11401.1 hypothetical protein ASD23_04925 [Agromyces sp. Root1464]